MYQVVRLLLIVFFVLALSIGAYIRSLSEPTDGVLIHTADWCGIASGAGPNGVDAVLTVSAETSEYRLLLRPSWYTLSNLNGEQEHRGHVTSIHPYGQAHTQGYTFFQSNGCPTTTNHCHLDLPVIGQSLVFEPVVVTVPSTIQNLLPVRDTQCPSEAHCGSGLSVLPKYPFWYGQYKDDLLSAACVFHGPNYNHYTLAISTGPDGGVQLCHGRRKDLPALETFDGLVSSVHLRIPTILTCHTVFVHRRTEHLPVPIPWSSDEEHRSQSDRVLCALLLAQDMPTNVLIGRRITTRTLLI